MKFILAIFILLFSNEVTAQSWEKLNSDFLALYDNEEFDKAAIVGEKAVAAAKNEFGDQHINYATSLYNLASVFIEKENYKKAELLLLQAKKIQEKILGESDSDYGNTINDLATLYVETGEYAKAEPLYLQSIKIAKNTTGTDDAEYMVTISNLAILYERMKLYDKAETLYLEAHQFYIKHPGENEADLESSFFALANLYDRIQQFQKAADYYLQSAGILKKYAGEVSEIYVRAITKLALIYSDLGQYDKAEPLYFDVADIWALLAGDKSPQYASALGNIGTHYQDIGSFEQALFFYNKAIEIASENNDKTNTDYVTFVNNLALLYLANGKYDLAEPLLVKAKEVYHHIYGENDDLYATSLSNLATMYFSIGQYEKAEPLFMESLMIKKKISGEDNVSYAISLNNLGLLYATTGEYKKAEALYLQSKSIRQKLGANKQSEYATLLDNLAILYTILGQKSKVEPLYLEAKMIRQQLFGEMHPDYATSLNNLAYYYMEQENFILAEKYFLQAKDILQKAYGDNSPSYAVVLDNLARLYVKSNQLKKAEPYLQQASKIVLQNMLTTFSVLSESEKNNYLKKNTGVFETINSYLYLNKKASPEIIKSIFNLQLLLKSASLSDTKNMMETLLSSPDTAIRRLFSLWTTNRNILAKQYSLPVEKRRSGLKKIEAQTEAGEKDLNVLSAEFRNQQNTLTNKLPELHKNLESDEAAIEFVRFRFLSKDWTDSIMYAAYILRKSDTVPVFVPLFEEQQLQTLIDSAGTNTTAIVKKFYRGIDIGDNQTTTYGATLYKLVWYPLEKHLTGIKKVAYSPAGKLYNIAFHALPTDSTSLLMDKYGLQQYTSTREINNRSLAGAKKPGSITLFGNASFTLDSVQLLKQKSNESAKGNVSTSIYIPEKTNNNNYTWQNLPGTGEEVNKIKELFEQNKINVTLLVEKQATEDKLKRLSGNSPQVLHIATHGFFLPEPDVEKKQISSNKTFSLAEDPLLRSGLILAGGNYAWSGKTPIEGVEDGIATAYEISQLNLSNTELVVLSACETALGDVKGSEGVFGLQRAFKMAGVKKMIVSLWQVPDKETAELMTAFYTYWMKGKTIEESFAQAQADMRKKYSPFYWAAFVLVE